MMCNSFIVAGLLDLSAFPILSAHVFSCRFFRTQVFLRVCLDAVGRDPIYDLVLFHIGVGGVRYHLKASGKT